MAYPDALHVVEHAPATGWEGYDGPVVVLVHGSLDRAASFGRTMRRLTEWGIVAYDRRGYQSSRDGYVGDREGPHFAEHVADLRAVAAGAPGRRGHLHAVGHSVGGNVVMGAALADPTLFASIGAFEPPLPWLGYRRLRPRGERATGAHDAPGVQPADAPSPTVPPAPFPPLAVDPAEEAERFFRRMVGDSTWERLPRSLRAERRADGPALVADLLDLRGPALFDASALGVPAVFGCSDSPDEAHHRRIVDWLVEHVAGAELVEIAESAHGAHLSHPDAFAEFVRTVVRAGSP